MGHHWKYSPVFFDSRKEYRVVQGSSHSLATKDNWSSLGIQMSRGWSLLSAIPSESSLVFVREHTKKKAQADILGVSGFVPWEIMTEGAWRD